MITKRVTRVSGQYFHLIQATVTNHVQMTRMNTKFKAGDVSGIVAKKLASGWVLTDIPCEEPGCKVPLMHSPKGSDPVILFCPACDGSPGQHNPTTSSQSSSGSHLSRSSTPPTEVSSAMNPHVLATPPLQTEDMMRRRQQSDTASAEIGNRLLKGWAMLADECPNVGCYGVPLVRPPKTGSGKDPKKECVVCGTVYISQHNGGLLRRVETLNGALPGPVDHASSEVTTASADAGRGLVRTDAPQPDSKIHERTVATDSLSPGPGHSTHQAVESTSTNPTALENSARSLETTLHMLSERLNLLSNEGSNLDVSSIGCVADAIFRVTQALGQGRYCHNDTFILSRLVEDSALRLKLGMGFRTQSPLVDHEERHAKHLHHMHVNPAATACFPHACRVISRCLPEELLLHYPKMSPFNIFRAFSGSSRNNNPGRHVGRHRSRRSKIVKRRREHVVEQEYVPDEVVPWSAIFSTAENHDVGCYGPGYYNTADIYHPQPTRPPSPIPAVYRQDSHSRLHEDYLLSNQQRTFSADGYDTTSWREVEGARWQIPVKVNSSSVGSSERIRSGRYQEAEDLHPKGYHSFPYDSSSNLGHQSQLPTFVRVGDDKKVIIHRYDGSRNAWDERTHSHSSDSIRAYYIVPPGVSVIFEDEDGNEITRVGDFNSRTRHSSRHPNPFIIQDEDGHELYRSRSEKSSATSYSSNLSDDTSYGNCRHRMHHNSRFHHEAHSDPLQEPYEDQRNIRSNHVPSSNFSSLRPTYSFILIDGEGRQIPIRLNGHEFT